MHTEITVTESKKITFPLLLLFVYIMIEYGKPAILDPIRPSLILQGLFLLFLIKKAEKVKEIIKDKYFILYTFLLMEMTVNGFIASNNYWAFMQWRLMISYFIFSLAFCLFIDSITAIRTFLTGFIIIVAIVAIALYLKVGAYLGGVRILGDTNDLALAMNVMIPISFFMGMSYRGIKRIFFWITTVIFVMTNVFAFSRGGFVGMAGVAFLCWWNTKAKMKSLLILLLIVIAFVTLIPQEYKAELHTITEEGTESGTGRDRIELWKVGWKMFLDNPLLGVGQGNMPYRLGEYQYDREGQSFWGREITTRTVHSIYVQVLTELGIIGILIWGLIIKNILFKSRYVIRVNKEMPVGDDDQLFLKTAMTGLLIGLGGYFISGVFLSAFYYPYFWNLAGLITAVYIQSQRDQQAQ